MRLTLHPICLGRALALRRRGWERTKCSWCGSPQADQEARASGKGLVRVCRWRWSSSSQPWLRQGPVVENLQVLDPATNRGMNLLRLHGPLGAVAAISVVAHLEVAGEQRVTVRFERGGWIGPRLGSFRPELMAKVAQSFPAWLDITYLDDWLRLCRGHAGTVFALVRRLDLTPEQLLPAD